ncbi:ABC transporter permease [uncultured Megasphaera sp.]|uniref:ABC transporter permease n=1 Tax=uncultured Megasphaera sp. TaxID=165188 RepID=UPI00265988EF|nr:ABC transporter permease [uncultured Megasphaera sp.]
MTQKKAFYFSSRTVDIINYLLFPAIILLIWFYATTEGHVSELLMPSIPSVAANIGDQIHTGQLQKDILISLSSVLRGYFLGAALAIVIGVAMGLSARSNKFFALVMDSIRQVPGLAWFPLIILWFGVGDMAKIVLVARGAFFPVLINTIHGVQGINPAYRDLIRLYHVKRWDVITKLYIPSALPFVCTGLRLGAGMAWMSVVAAEMMGATSGLGFRIITAQQLMKSNILIADIIVIGILGWILDYGLKTISRKAQSWKDA